MLPCSQFLATCFHLQFPLNYVAWCQRWSVWSHLSDVRFNCRQKPSLEVSDFWTSSKFMQPTDIKWQQLVARQPCKCSISIHENLRYCKKNSEQSNSNPMSTSKAHYNYLQYLDIPWQRQLVQPQKNTHCHHGNKDPATCHSSGSFCKASKPQSCPRSSFRKNRPFDGENGGVPCCSFCFSRAHPPFFKSGCRNDSFQILEGVLFESVWWWDLMIDALIFKQANEGFWSLPRQLLENCQNLVYVWYHIFEHTLCESWVIHK